jgi:MSHA pilin protein MshD
MHGSASRTIGFTLIETVIAIVVFAVAMTFLIVAFNPATTQSADPILQIRAAELAQSYMEEIMSKRFDENNGVGSRTRCGEAGQPACSASLGPDGGESRATFDDVDDYHGLDEAPTDALGNLRANYSSAYRVSVSVSYAGGDLGLNANDAKRIDLVVQAPNQSSYNFTFYKTNI